MMSAARAGGLWRYYLARLKASEYVFMILVATVIGLGGGLTAVALRYLIGFFQWVSFGSWSNLLEAAHRIPWYLLIFIPAIGGLIVGPMVYRIATEARGHGVPEVMEAVAVHGGVIRPRVVLIKALASAVCIGTGGSTGREGPIVQIGSALGSSIGQGLKVSARRLRTMVGCGAAAGIAGAFNAPIAGALFAVEIILGDFGVPQFSPIVISSVVATVVSRYFLGDMPAFIVPRYELVSGFELVPYALLGLVAAFVGVGFTTLLYRVEDVFDSLRVPDITKPAIGG
ncbi:MAG: chloride channel protein [Calditrichaeota bacterium]|nr:chloride channel protein [Calditrichota bacterium]